MKKDLIRIIKMQGNTVIGFARQYGTTAATLYNWNREPSKIQLAEDKKLKQLLGIDYTMWINSVVK